MTKRRSFTSEFKAKVALEALRGDKTIQEIAARHKVHPNQVSSWKAKLLADAAELFEDGRGRSARDPDEPSDLLVREDLRTVEPRRILRHAIRTTQVAAVGDRDT